MPNFVAPQRLYARKLQKFQSAPRPPSLMGTFVGRCKEAACSLIIAAAWVRRLPLMVWKSRVVTLCSQNVHLNVVPPLSGLVV
jgi:hypothetical protein